MSLSSLEKYLPKGALSYVERWIEPSPVEIFVRNERKTKLGDYRYIPQTETHQITVNKSLESEAFFFVLTHEIAHFRARLNYGKRIKPHGLEWKKTFGKLLLESLEIYEKEKHIAILNHAKNPKASVGSDLNVYTVLFKNPDEKRVGELREKQRFRIGKKIFEKGEKQKIRYICKELKTGRKYSVSGMAIIDEIFE